MYTYMLNNKVVAADQALKYPVIVASTDPTDKADVIQVFESNEEFGKWADRTVHGEKVREVQRLLKEKVLPERENAAWVEKMQRLALAQAQKDFVAFAKLLNKTPLDEEVVRKAMIEKTPLTPKMFDPIFLYDREIEKEPPTGAPVDSRTATMFIPSGWWPDLNWIRWDNRVRSVRVFGLIALCENSWFNFFGGRVCWLIGFNGLFNLRHFGFDKVTSSIVAF